MAWVGGAFYVAGLYGHVTGCSFTQNSADESGALHVEEFTGDIASCEFERNYSPVGGGALTLNALDGNIQSSRFAEHRTPAILLGESDATAVIRNCLFTAPGSLGNVGGWAVSTSQNTSIENNTMVGPGVGAGSEPSAVRIGFGTAAEQGELVNNIIVDTEIGIHVYLDVDMEIKYNQFYNVPEIVCRGENCLGNDIWWLEQVLDNFRNNSYGDPLFVIGPSGDYYLSQIAAGQATDSPCVDAGSDLAANLGMAQLTTRTDYVPDAGLVDMGYHYGLAEVLRGDFDGDGDRDLVDAAGFQLCFGQEPISPECQTFDFDDSGDIDLNDFAGFQTSLTGPRRAPTR